MYEHKIYDYTIMQQSYYAAERDQLEDEIDNMEIESNGQLYTLTMGNRDRDGPVITIIEDGTLPQIHEKCLDIAKMTGVDEPLMRVRVRRHNGNRAYDMPTGNKTIKWKDMARYIELLELEKALR